MLTLWLVGALIVAPHPASGGAVGACTQAMREAGICYTNDGTSVTVGGTQTIPGSSSDSSEGSRDRSGSDRSSPKGIPDSSSSPQPSDLMLCSDWEYEFINVLNCVIPESDESDRPVFTIDDLARFLPEASSLVVEPEGVGVAGLPTNFVAHASTHTVHGVLFDHALSVRFTPSGYTFHRGDGTSLRTQTSGRTWRELGQVQFTPTETSHTYGERGTYVVRVDTHYTAELNIGYGWTDVAGELTSRGPEDSLRVYEARTALVARTCDVNRAAPGC